MLLHNVFLPISKKTVDNTNKNPFPFQLFLLWGLQSSQKPNLSAVLNKNSFGSDYFFWNELAEISKNKMKITERCSLEMVHINACQIYYKYSNVLQCLKMYSLWSLTPDFWSCQHEFKNQWKMFLPVSPARKSLNTWNLLVNFFSRVSLWKITSSVTVDKFYT